METDDPGKKNQRKEAGGAKEGESMAAAAPKLSVVPAARPTFREVYDAEFDYVWRVARRFGIEEKDAEDVVQVVFVRFHAAFEKWDPAKGSLRAFLSGFAWNVCSEFRKRASARYERPAGDLLPEVALADDARMEGRVDLRRVVDCALQVLTEDERSVFVLRAIEEHSMPEVAEILGKNENSCWTWFRSAKAKFERRFGQLRGDV